MKQKTMNPFEPMKRLLNNHRNSRRIDNKEPVQMSSLIDQQIGQWWIGWSRFWKHLSRHTGRATRTLGTALLVASLLLGLIPPPLIEGMITSVAPEPWAEPVEALLPTIPAARAQTGTLLGTFTVDQANCTNAAGTTNTTYFRNGGSPQSTPLDCVISVGVDATITEYIVTYSYSPDADSFASESDRVDVQSPDGTTNSHTGLGGPDSIVDHTYTSGLDTTLAGTQALGDWHIIAHDTSYAREGHNLVPAQTTLTLYGTSNGPTGGTIDGTVFRDYDDNATNASDEPGIESITVTATDANGNTATTTTDASGEYTIVTGDGAPGALSGTVRVEFTLPGDGSLDFLEPAAAGSTTVQFIDIDTGATANVGFFEPGDYCGTDNPDIATTCFSYGEYNDTNSADTALLTVPYNANGHHFSGTSKSSSFLGTELATFNDVGATYGLAWQKTTSRLYIGAYHKRNSGFGPNGPDAIYQYDRNGNQTGVIELDTLLGTTNSAGADTHDFTPDGSGTIYDLGTGNAVVSGVGKRSFGDLEMSGDGSILYLVNLFDRTIYALDVSDGVAGNASIADSWDAPDATGAARHRPFGLEWHNGKLWIGSVDENSTAAYVHSFDPDPTTNPGGTFTLELSFSLVYSRQSYVSSISATQAGRESDWNAWSDDPVFIYQNYLINAVKEIGYPQPILSDIAFDGEDMILGFRDRMGDQTGSASNFHPNDPNGRTWGTSAGDILRACHTAGGYIIESGSTGACSTTGGISPSGPNGVEYYHWDIFEDGTTWAPNSASGGAIHWETAQGAMIQIAGLDTVMTTAMDPVDDFSGGLLRLQNANGRREGVGSSDTASSSSLQGGYTLYETGDFGGSPPNNQATFAKGNGLGDLAAFCAVAPIELGNRVWRDTDGDGIQDPDEAGIDGVTVELIETASGNTIATAETANGGQWFFSSDSGTSTTNAIYGVAIAANTDYQVRIRDAQGASQQAALAGLSLTTINADSATDNNSKTDLRDSDASMDADTTTAIIDITTGVAGSNNHTLDFGFGESGTITLVVRTVGSDGTFTYTSLDADFSGISMATVANVITGTTVTKSPGTYTITQDLLAGWTLTGITINGENTADSTSSLGLQQGVINLQAGENVVIIFTNEQTVNVCDDHNTNNRVMISAVSSTSQNVSGEDKVASALIATCLHDYGDLPDDDSTAGSPNSPGYNTNVTTTVGASHVITPGLYLGSLVDHESDGQPTATADGDDVNTSTLGIGTGVGTADDEDGITFPTEFTAGTTATITATVVNTTGQIAYVYGFIDFDGDGAFTTTGEAVSTTVAASGDVNLTFNVPINGDTSQPLGARFRLSTDTELTADGAASDGEVEDYLVEISSLESLALEKTLISPANGIAMVGDIITFQLEITNTGTVTMAELNLVDRYDATILQYRTASIAPDAQIPSSITWTGDFGAGTGSLLPNLPLAPGASFIITVDMEVIAPTRD